MSAENTIDIEKALTKIGSAVMKALTYESYPYDELDVVLDLIESIMSKESYLIDCEIHLKSSGSEFVLFYISNILYNLKTKEELKLTPDSLKWLGSVWKNFIIRNKSYQDLFKLVDKYKKQFDSYYPVGGNFVNQIDNAHLVKQDYIDDDPEGTHLKNLEKFYLITTEVISWMKPTYFFLLDYYYELRIRTGHTNVEGTVLEKNGLIGFGQKLYSYNDLSVMSCQTLGVLEAIYLILKKKSSSRRIFTIDGKQKFLTTPEIYNFYLEKFNAMKKELQNLHK
mgnify:CR=1 FL=1